MTLVSASIGSILPKFFLASQDAVATGILWGIMAMGVYISYKILDYADLSVDGTFALGGAVSAFWIVNKGGNPFVALVFSMLAGMVAGSVTGLLHTKLKIPPILSGILTMLGLYSINLTVMGQPNVSMGKSETIITILTKLFGIKQDQIPFTLFGMEFAISTRHMVNIGLGLVMTVATIAILYCFFGTELGAAIRATGNNENMVRALGVNTDTMKIIGLLLSNGLVALSGGIVAQSQAYSDVQMGVGTIVVGLASIIIGEVIFGTNRSFATKLLSAVVGSIIYRLIIALVLQMGLNTNFLKLFTACLVALALTVPLIQRQIRSISKKPALKKDGGNSHVAD